MAVIAAYIERIKQVNPLINAVVEARFEAALQDAKNADLEVDLAHQHGTLDDLARQKPLLGVPLTVKESCAVKGYLCVLFFFFLLLRHLRLKFRTYRLGLIRIRPI